MRIPGKVVQRGSRVALVPDLVAKLHRAGPEVGVAAGAGVAAGFGNAPKCMMIFGEAKDSITDLLRRTEILRVR